MPIACGQEDYVLIPDELGGGTVARVSPQMVEIIRRGEKKKVNYDLDAIYKNLKTTNKSFRELPLWQH